MSRVPKPIGHSNPKLAELRRVIRRQEEGVTVVDGVALVRDLAALGVTFQEVFATARHWPGLLQIPALAALDSGALFEIDEETSARIAPSQHGQGVLAVAVVPRFPYSVAPLSLYLDRIQDPGNLGALVRTAAALGAQQVICSPGCADPFSPRAVRASAGQTLLFPVIHPLPIRLVAEAVAGAGGYIAGTSGSGGVPVTRWQPRSPLVVAFGNEGQGLSEEVLDACAELVTIPIAGPVESLNVAVSAGIIVAALQALPGFRADQDSR